MRKRNDINIIYRKKYENYHLYTLKRLKVKQIIYFESCMYKVLKKNEVAK